MIISTLEQHLLYLLYVGILKSIILLGLSLMFYYLNIIEAMKWMFSLSGFFLVNKIPMIFTLCMQNTDTSNVSLINICLFMVS